jgi:hypothetical protein
MNAPVNIVGARPQVLGVPTPELVPVVDILGILAQSGAASWQLYRTPRTPGTCQLELPDVVDPLWDFAQQTGLVATLGRDTVQEIIAGPFARLRREV